MSTPEIKLTEAIGLHYRVIRDEWHHTELDDVPVRTIHEIRLLSASVDHSEFNSSPPGRENDSGK